MKRALLASLLFACAFNAAATTRPVEVQIMLDNYHNEFIEDVKFYISNGNYDKLISKNLHGSDLICDEVRCEANEIEMMKLAKINEVTANEVGLSKSQYAVYANESKRLFNEYNKQNLASNF